MTTRRTRTVRAKPASRGQRTLYPKTAKDALARWDANESVFTIEMGGLGPGYEQCIQICVFEIIREYGKRPVNLEPTTAFERQADRVMHRLDGNLGLSGAQAGAAKSLAYNVIKNGWGKTLKSVGTDRLIQVSKSFPEVAGPKLRLGQDARSARRPSEASSP